MDRRLATNRPAGPARNTPRRASRAVFLIDYVTWYARLAGSTRPVSAERSAANVVESTAGGAEAA
jgi:hypothetical protein